MIIPFQSQRVDSYGGSTVVNENETSFVGGVWRDHIRPRVGLIVGGLIGGPIGAVAGEFAQRLVNSCVNGRLGTIGGELANSASETDINFPLNFNDSQKLDNWVDNQLTPTIQKLINNVDTAFNGGTTITNNVINAANATLRKASILKAYSQIIKNHGEPNSSEAYTQNKANVLKETVVAIEKSVFRHLKDNTPNYKTVLTPITASNSNRVENIILKWQNRNVTAQATKYVLKTQNTSQNETEVEITNTNIGNTSPATTGNENQIKDEPKKTNWFKTGFGLLAGFVVVKNLVK